MVGEGTEELGGILCVLYGGWGTEGLGEILSEGTEGLGGILCVLRWWVGKGTEGLGGILCVPDDG